MPKSVVGDKLKVRILNQTKEAIRAEIVEILVPGTERITPPCPHFAACGGCSLQQLNESSYRHFKQRIALNSLRHAGFDTAPETIFLTPPSRRRTEFRLVNENGKISLAYLGIRSHSKVAIKTCLILTPELQKFIPLLPEKLALLPFVSDIETISLTALDSGVEAVISLKGSHKPGVYRSALENLANIGFKRVALSNEKNDIITLYEPSPLTLRLGKQYIPLPPDSFLQATKEGGDHLTSFVLKHAAGNSRIADLFCGIGAYSFPLAERSRVHAVDFHAPMMESLKRTAASQNIPITTETRDLFQKPLTVVELTRFDAVVINPPRAGAAAQCMELATSAVKTVVMVSCNPGTFARDAKILKNAGFLLKDAIAIDQFVWSPHLEIAASFNR